ncbi:hypothetical protein CC78DRAFT_574233 [Lojkania enalia]|uniref:Uncharacterized protein n=1 Tax=Lojkania enalia TaxID=147567 RepID=A0A9P4NBB6_9PLEO|nr:hypothetical protein CC78DRAFT_574233 [Didymosphaeria enalia]
MAKISIYQRIFAIPICAIFNGVYKRPQRDFVPYLCHKSFDLICFFTDGAHNIDRGFLPVEIKFADSPLTSVDAFFPECFGQENIRTQCLEKLLFSTIYGFKESSSGFFRLHIFRIMKIVLLLESSVIFRFGGFIIKSIEVVEILCAMLNHVFNLLQYMKIDPCDDCRSEVLQKNTYRTTAFMRARSLDQISKVRGRPKEH